MTTLKKIVTTITLLSSFLFPSFAHAQLIQQPVPDIFGGGQINLLYRVLDAHPEVGRAIGLDADAVFLAKGTDAAVYLIHGKIANRMIVGERFLFRSEAVYHTWFPDFILVRHFRDEAIENTASRGDMLPAPGTLVKQPDNPRVYVATLGRLLRPLENEALAQKLFGARWNKNIGLLDEFAFSEYNLGPSVTTATRLTELDIPPLPADTERLRVATFEIAGRTNRKIDQELRDLYRQILARRYLNIFITWKQETGSFPPSPDTAAPGQIHQVEIGVPHADGTVAALKAHENFAGAVKYVPEKECAGTACFAFVPDTEEAACGTGGGVDGAVRAPGAAPFHYSSNGAGFALDFCIESAAIITLPEVALEIHQRDMPMLARGWYRFTEAGLRELP